MIKKRFIVTGMNCAACSSHVERAVKNVNGVSNVNVNLIANNMIVVFDEKITDSETIISAVIKAGYGASAEDIKSNERTNEFLNLKRKLIISVTLLLVLMYVGMGHMIGLPIPKCLSISNSPLGFSLIMMLLSAVIIGINFKYYISGFSKLFRLSPNMDSLVAMGSCVSFIYSSVLTFFIFKLSHNNDIAEASVLAHRLYFESAAMILVFISIGKTLESRSKLKTRDAIDSLIKLKPDTAVRLSEQGEEVISASQIQVNDILIIRSGSSVPADGIIIEGHGSIDESVLTGESIPCEKGVGNELYQATINVSGFIKLKVTAIDSDTALSKIIELVEEASSTKAPISRLADKISAVFVPVVFGISAVTFVIWLLLGAPFYEALNYAITVIVISCPCSLGLATPTAIAAGTGRAAKLGILIKNAATLEQIHRIDSVVFDKTGTLTEGRLYCTDFIPAGDIEINEFAKLVYAAECMSEHPIAKAITEYIEKNFSYRGYNATDFESIEGGGIRACINGKDLYCGNIPLISSHIVLYTGVADKLAEEGKTPIIFEYDDRYVGIIAVADTIRADGAFAVGILNDIAVNTVMLTGDNEVTAKSVADNIGISAFKASLKPLDKAEYIEELRSSGHHVLMVGDGINDAPALTVADIGVAIGAGTDIAIDSADIIHTGTDLTTVADTILLGRKVIRIIKENLFWAFFYNCIGIPIAAGVFSSLGVTLNPMIAAALMSLSSIFVVTNALRINLYEPIEKLTKTSDNKADADNFAESDDKEKEAMKVNVIVNGMMCVHCKAHVEEAFNSVEGIQCVVDLDSKTAALTLSKDFTDEELFDIVKKAGYEPVSVNR